MKNINLDGYDYYNLIVEDLKKLKNMILSFDKQLSKINKDEDIMTIKSRLYVLMNNAEKLAIKSREIPLCTTCEEMEIDKAKVCDVKIEMKEEIIEIQIPILIPKSRSNKTNKSYLVGMFHDIFKKQFSSFEKYDEPVIIWFEHQYRKRNGKQVFRDHDNVETKIVKDLLIPYLIHDDCPLYCDDFQTSKTGLNDATIIRIVPRRLFAEYCNKRWYTNDKIS